MGLASRIGTYMEPFQGFGPNWDQVPKLGHHYQHCSCYLDFFFSETKFSKTETFFRDQNFPKPKPRLFFRNQIFRNRNRDFFSETETLKDLAKVSKPKCQSLLETDISVRIMFCGVGIKELVWVRADNHWCLPPIHPDR